MSADESPKRFRLRAGSDRIVSWGWGGCDRRAEQLDRLLAIAAAYAEATRYPPHPVEFILAARRWQWMAALGHDCEPGADFDGEMRATIAILEEMGCETDR